MITVISKVKLPGPWTLAEANARFDTSTLKYQGIEGLHRKYFAISPDGMQGAGVYLWRSREDAERLYTKDWLADQEARFGSPMELTWWDTGAVVDNLTGEIIR